MQMLNTGLYQQQRVTTRLVQDMNILQMSTAELEEYLETLALENPVIELQDAPGDEDLSGQRERYRQQEWLSSSDRQNREYEMDERSPNRENLWKDGVAQEDTLSGFLRSQLVMKDYGAKERRLLVYILSSLDEDGYYREELEEAAAHCAASIDAAERMLREIQALDPAGVGARDLKECLLLQAERNYPDDTLLQRVIRECLPEIAKNHLRDAARKLGVSASEVAVCGEQLRTLDPRPGSAFSGGEQPSYVRPDAMVIAADAGFEVLIREDQRLRFQTSEYYRDLAKTTEDRETRDYLRSKLRQADSVSASIAMRTSNLSRVLAYLVARQEPFFREGPGNRQPMKLSDIAEELRIHISTVSRTMRGKYLQCTWGVYPLSYFLTGVAAVSLESGQEQTREGIKAKLRELIESEDKKKPYSDETLCRLLKEQYRIQISRRTINKYRLEMNIPDRSGRRQWD